jgi:AcrR family transcriptional regulator
LVEDRRQQIVNAGLAILREDGLPGLTQPRICARTGLRQSHLTYYYPTRLDLLTAVTRAAIDRRRVAAQATAAGISSIDDAVSRIAAFAAQHENTRVLLALMQAVDQYPTLQALFDEMTNDMLVTIQALFVKLGIAPTPANTDLLHALVVGLSVVDLATGRSDNQERVRATLAAALQMLTAQQIPRPENGSRSTSA